MSSRKYNLKEITKIVMSEMGKESHKKAKKRGLKAYKAEQRRRAINGLKKRWAGHKKLSPID